ncbi:MAG: putative DNA-binding domain-containing protein [Proteobacteria bacterium]|nr:putative DNA-binding domain-containing protein [Pseudomonadota bacterium]
MPTKSREKRLPPLRELQRRFAAGLFEPQDVPRQGLILAAGIEPALRVGIYTNNWRQGVREALALIYPVAERLVGTEYFASLADDYRSLHHSTRGDLHYVGAAFPAFLRTQFANGPYAYLADVAALEWAIEDARRAALVEALSPDALRDTPPEQYAQLHFKLHPAARLSHSPFPIRRIWLANQPKHEAVETVRLDAGGDWLLIRVMPDEIALAALDEAGYAFAAALGQGSALGEAADLALAIDAAFDLGATLRQLFVLGALR